LNAVDPQLESAWFQPCNLSSDFLASKFAFKCNLPRYTTENGCDQILEGAVMNDAKATRTVGLTG
jgi:hypothetical protein